MKPFAAQVPALADISARSPWGPSPVAERKGVEMLEALCGPYVIDRHDQSMWLFGRRLRLNRLQYRIATLLMSRRGRTVHREEILSLILDASSRHTLGRRVVDVQIHRLRTELRLAETGHRITARYGIGYVFA